ncbi:SMI1/KNR4 family protein [Cronobacter dublinensis]|uniref:SMI1/KNR4 family protein n=1 Tax=Cronobacter dublinensis TaxID=413497 RepID=UPI001F3FC24F
MRQNGGESLWAVLTRSSMGGFPLKHSLMTYSAFRLLRAKYGPWHKKEFIPFAYDNGGNPFFLSLKASDYGHIYLYAQDGDALFEVAESFDDFIRALYRL